MSCTRWQNIGAIALSYLHHSPSLKAGTWFNRTTITLENIQLPCPMYQDQFLLNLQQWVSTLNACIRLGEPANHQPERTCRITHPQKDARHGELTFEKLKQQNRTVWQSGTVHQLIACNRKTENTHSLPRSVIRCRSEDHSHPYLAPP